MFDGFLKILQYWYLQYELVTCIYMFEPWERKLLSAFYNYLYRDYQEWSLNAKGIYGNKYSLLPKYFTLFLSNSIIFATIVLVSYSSYMYLPHYTVSLLSRLKVMDIINT